MDANLIVQKMFSGPLKPRNFYEYEYFEPKERAYPQEIQTLQIFPINFLQITPLIL